MKLANYISDLLYRYDCVIIPEFGGFVTNNKSAKINAFSNTFYPPYKELSFNSLLKNNDGLLANYIASVEKIPYESALNFIKFEVEDWFNKLKYEDVDFENVGTISLQDNNLIFEPSRRVNFLTSSFGLNNVVSPEIKRESYLKKVEELEEKAPILVSNNQKKAPDYLKYAAIFVLGLSAIGFGGKLYKDYSNKQAIVEAKKEQKEIETKIEKATFVISKPLPAINIDIKAEKQTCHVIAGAFRIPENASKKLLQLKDQGFDNARILGLNKWGLTVVSYDSFMTREESLEKLAEIKQNQDKDAWVMIQEF